MKAAVLLASLIVAGAGTTALVACTTTNPGGTSNAAADPNSHRFKCFDPAMVRNFESVDDHTMVITTDWNDAFKLTLGPACIGLDTSTMIGIRSRSGVGDVCGPFDADIIYSDIGERPRQSCSITAVEHLTGDAAAPYVGTRKKQ